MKLKKILSGFLAAAMAVTSMVTASVTAGAATETTFPISTGANGDDDWVQVTINDLDIDEENAGIAGLIFSYTSTDTSAWGSQYQVYPTDWSSAIVPSTNLAVTGTPIYVMFPYNSATMSEGFVFQAWNVTIPSLDVTYKLGSSELVLEENSENGYSKYVDFSTDTIPQGTKYIVFNYSSYLTGQDENDDWYYSKIQLSADKTSGEGWETVADIDPTCAASSTYTYDKVSDLMAKETIHVQGHNIHITSMDFYGDLPVATTHKIEIADGIKNGTVTAKPTEAAKGDKVELAVTPDDGYALKTLTVTAKKDSTAKIDVAEDNSYFIMPDDDVTVSATFEASEVALTGITLDKETATVLVGKTVALTATKAPENTTDETAITWTSDTPAVATVSASGVVTGVAAGTANITATCGEKTATCKVTVSAEAKPCTAIALGEPVSVAKGASETLTATVTPTDTTDEITWTSSAPAVATVDATGKVTGVARGKATITVTCGEKTATCEVSVSEDKTVTAPVTAGGTPKSYEVTATAADGTKVKTVDTVYAITEADLACEGYIVTITNTKNNKSITREIKNAYKSVTVKSAEDLGNDTFTGYFLVVRVKNVPEDVTLSYSFDKIPAKN